MVFMLSIALVLWALVGIVVGIWFLVRGIREKNTRKRKNMYVCASFCFLGLLLFGILEYIYAPMQTMFLYYFYGIEPVIVYDWVIGM